MKSIIVAFLQIASFVLVILLTLPISSAAQDSDLFEGSIFRVEYSLLDPTDTLTEKYDVFCLERPGFKVEVPWDAVQTFNGADFTVQLHDMGMIECPHGWDLHLMGNSRTTGLWTSDIAAVYRVSPETSRDYYVTVWFRGLDASVHVEGKQTYIRTRVHHLYCDGNAGDECWIEMTLPNR